MMSPKSPTDKIYGPAEAYRRSGEPDATSYPEAESIEESVPKKQDSTIEEFVFDPQLPINKKSSVAEACHRVVEKPKIEELDLDPQEASSRLSPIRNWLKYSVALLGRSPGGGLSTLITTGCSHHSKSMGGGLIAAEA